MNGNGVSNPVAYRLPALNQVTFAGMSAGSAHVVMRDGRLTATLAIQIPPAKGRTRSTLVRCIAAGGIGEALAKVDPATPVLISGALATELETLVVRVAAIQLLSLNS